MRNLFFLIFFSSFFSFFGQEIGDSIIFTTKSGKDYRGILEKKDQDGYFFKTSNDRIIYLSKGEIKEFQKIKKEILKDDPSIKVIPEITTKENTEKKIVTEDFNNSSKTEYSIKQISVLIGIEDVTIVLNDGRNFKGKIQKIEYPNGFEQVGSKMIWFESDDKNYKFKEHEINKAFKDVNTKQNVISENQEDHLKKSEKGLVPLFQFAFNDFNASTFGVKYYILNSSGGGYASTSLGFLGGDNYEGLPFLFTVGFLTETLIEEHNDFRFYFGGGIDIIYEEVQLEIGLLIFMKKIILDVGYRQNIEDPSWSTISLGLKKNI